MKFTRTAHGNRLNLSKGFLLALAIVFFSILLIIMSFRWNWLRIPLDQLVSAQLKREITVTNLKMEFFSWKPWLRVQGLRLANSPWGRQPFLAEVEELMIQINPLALLHGQWMLPEVVLTRPALHLELSPQNVPNWVFGEQKEKTASSNLSIGRLTIRDGLLTFFAPHLNADLTAQVTEFPIPGNRALTLRGSGRIRDGHAELDLRGDSLAKLLVAGRPYGMDGCFTWGNTHGRWGGTLKNPFIFQGADFEFEMSGPSPAAIFPITGIKLPALPPYRVQAHVSQQENKWIAQDIQGTVGGSDFSGDIMWEEVTGKPPHLTGRLKSNQMALKDIGIGKEPPEDTSKQPEPMMMDVNLEFYSRRVFAPPLSLETLKTQLRVKEGKIHLDALSFEMTGGQVRAIVSLDTHYNPMPTSIDAHFQRLDLSQLLAPLKLSQHNRGTLSGRLHLISGGGPVFDLLASAKGTAFFIVTRGQLDSLLLALARLDLAKTLNSLLLLDNSVELRCAVAQVDARDGILSITPLVVDTTSTKVTGGGTIDLRRKQLDITIEPQPKDLSLFSAYSPFHITGSFQSPEVRPKVGQIGGRMAAAAALAALVGPIGAVMSFIEPGIGEDNDCQDLMRSISVPFE